MLDIFVDPISTTLAGIADRNPSLFAGLIAKAPQTSIIGSITEDEDVDLDKFLSQPGKYLSSSKKKSEFLNKIVENEKLAEVILQTEPDLTQNLIAERKTAPFKPKYIFCGRFKTQRI